MNSFGDSLEQLPVDEQFNPQPEDLPLIQTIFTPIPEPDTAYYGKLAAFGAISYVVLHKTPFVQDWLSRSFESPTNRQLVQLGIVAGSTYLLSKFLK